MTATLRHHESCEFAPMEELSCGLARTYALQSRKKSTEGDFQMTHGVIRKALVQSSALRALAIALGVGGLVAPIAASAQDTAAPQDESGGLDVIVVSAQKREEDLQDAALSITSIGAEALAEQGVIDFADLAGLAPAVQIQPIFIPLTYVRSVGNFSAQPAVDQSIAYNVDGIYLDRPYATPAVLFDLERIEILRGPQGTLQGRNSPGGAINYVTAVPTMEFAASGAITFGNYDLVTVDAMVNMPLAEGVALRVAASSTDRDGYFDNGFGDANARGIRARLLLEPTNNLDILLSAEFTERNELGPTNSPCPPGSVDAACAGVPWDPFAGTPGQGTDGNIDIDEQNMLASENYAFYAEINYDLDFATLTWVPNYRHHTYRSLQTYSHFFGFYPAVDDSMHSQELRLASNPGSSVEWVVGAYYGRQTSEELLYFLGGEPPFVTVNRPGFPEVGHINYRNDVEDYRYRSTSAFGQVSVPLFEGFRLVGGLRYTDERKSLAGAVSVVLAGPTEVSVDTQALQELSKLTYKAGFEYDLTDDILLYANVSTGFKAGGVNAVPPDSGLPTTFNPEENTAWQGGFKGRFLGNTLQINTEAFYYDYRGYLSSAFGLTPEGLLVALNVNSQKARMYGAEVESIYLATPDDRIDLSISLLNAHHVEFVIPSSGLDLSGKTLPNAPDFTLSAGYSHTFNLANGGSLVAEVRTRYESSQWVDYRLSPGSFQEGFWRHSANLTYHSSDDSWSIGAWMRNISNNAAIMTAVGGLGPYQLAYPYAPRTYGVRIAANY